MTAPSSIVNTSANAAPKATLRHSSDANGANATNAANATAPHWRRSCQIIYVLGVEGSNHHGFVPVLRRLAEAQVDPITGAPFHVRMYVNALRSAMFGFKGKRSAPVNDTRTVQETLDRICPPTSLSNESSKMHVIIEGNSFPSGHVHNKHSRVGRQERWSGMSSEEIAADEAANNHPVNLHEFYLTYSPYVDVKFIVLHRPYLETIASHDEWDSGPVRHSNVIGGFLRILSRFLAGHLRSSAADDDAPVWTLVCTDALGSSRRHGSKEAGNATRGRVVGRLADFLGWPRRSCKRCFDEWKESAKAPARDRLGRNVTDILLGHARQLEGIWPPRREEDNLAEQHCEL